MTSLSARFGLSANGLAKICDRLDIARPPKGFWKAGAHADIDALIQNLEDPEEEICIGGKTSASRRSRTRLSPEERRQQMLSEARRIADQSGVHDISLRTIARNLGISEAQAHNCFSTREDLLEQLAFEELRGFEAVRQDAIRRGNCRVTKIVMSSVSYLRESARRGPLLTQIMADSAIRKRVDQRETDRREKALQRHVDMVIAETQTPPKEALLRTRMLTDFVKQAGFLVAEQRLSITDAEKLALPVIIGAALNR